MFLIFDLKSNEEKFFTISFFLPNLFKFLLFLRNSFPTYLTACRSSSRYQISFICQENDSSDFFLQENWQIRAMFMLLELSSWSLYWEESL